MPPPTWPQQIDSYPAPSTGYEELRIQINWQHLLMGTMLVRIFTKNINICICMLICTPHVEKYCFFLPRTIFKKCTRSIKKIKIRQGRKKMPTISCNLFTFLLKVSGKSRCQKMGFFLAEWDIKMLSRWDETFYVPVKKLSRLENII